MEDSDPTDACSLESWLRCHGSDRNRAYVPCANGHTLHITQLVNEYFNGNVEHASTDRLRRTAQTARFGQTPTNVNNVALSDNCNFDEDAVTVGAIFLALVTFIWGSQRTCSVGTFSFSWCTVDGARVYGTTKEALATGHAIPATGQFLPFVTMTSDPTLLRWTGRFGPECEFPNGHVFFLDAQMGADGRWLIPVGTLSAFVKTAKVPHCPQLLAEPYAGVAHTSVRPAEATEFCLFCGAAIALARMRHHVAVHLQKGEVVTDPRMHGEAEPCGFCGRTTGTCATSIVGKKISSTCPCVVPLKLAMATRKKENMLRECPIPGCSATPWVLNIKTHLARCHPTVPPNTVDLTEWVVVGQDDEKKKGRAKKIPIVMKPKITLKVAKAVDNESASFSEASLGRSDWDWKPEEDASSVESRSYADNDSSSGNESAATSEDGNSSSSSSSSSSSTSSSGRRSYMHTHTHVTNGYLPHPLHLLALPLLPL